MNERIAWIALGILVLILILRPIVEKKPVKYLDIHEEVASGDIEAVEHYISSGEDLQKRDAFGLTPLHIAASYGQAEMVEMLLEAGAEPNATDRGNLTPLDKAFQGKNDAPPGTHVPGSDYEKTIKLLREHGASTSDT